MGPLKGIIICLVIYTAPVFADNSNAPLRNIFPRTEFSNEALLNGINYNVWWYRAFSIGTSWNGPENAISKIEERADRSSQDAQQLLLGLSAILKNEAPAGDYVVNLYGSLLKKSQKQSAMPISTLSQVFSDRGWNQNTNQESQFNQNDSVNKKLIDFIVRDLQLPSLRDSRHLSGYNLLLSIYLNFGDRTVTNNLASMITQISQSNNETLKVDVSEKLFDLMTMNRLYFQSSEITQTAVSTIELRRLLLNSINSVKRRELVTRRIDAYQVSSDVYLSYFNFKKIEVDLAILEELGGVEALNAYAQKIRQMVELTERIDRRISEETARISRSVGYVPRSAIGGIMRSYQGGDVTVSDSRETAEVIRLIDLRSNTERETRELINSVKQVCYTASQRSDEVVLRSCANSVIENLLLAQKETRSNSSLRQDFSDAISYVLNISGKYFNPNNFKTKCNEFDLEKAVNEATERLKEILNLRVRLPENYRFVSEGRNTRAVKYFMFVDCSLPQYSSNNRYITYGGSFGDFRMEDVFYADENTVASCISPYARTNASHRSRILGAKISLNSAQRYSFLSSISARLSETIGARELEYRITHGEDQYDDFSKTLNAEDNKFVEVISSLTNRHIPGFFSDYYGYPMDHLSRQDDIFSGNLLPIHLKKICLSKKSQQNPINCLAGRGQIRCKENSLFKANFDIKQ